MRKVLLFIFPVLLGLYLGLNVLIGHVNSNQQIEYWKTDDLGNDEHRRLDGACTACRPVRETPFPR